MRHALITGGAGFIGSHLADHLLQEGWQVTTIDNFDPFYPKDQKLGNIENHLLHPHYRLIEADLRSYSQLSSVIPANVDVIIHLAAKAGVRPSIEAPMEYQETNVAGTQHLLELARGRGIRQFVFASSSSVYGTNPSVPWQETCTPLPISPYASTKLSGEYLGHVYSHLFGIRFVALRFFTVFGPRQRPDLAIRKFAELMLKGRSIPVFGDGSTSRDYTYVSDTVQGIRAAMDFDKSSFEVVNLGNCRTVTLLRMIETIGDALQLKPEINWLPDQPGDVPATFADISKAQRLLAYSPETGFEQGVSDFIGWLRAQHSRTDSGS